MKITDISEPFVVEYIDTDLGEYSSFCRFSGGSSISWEQRMGESSEPVYDHEELESLYQSFKALKS